MQRYSHKRAPQADLETRIQELARERPRFGYRRLTVLLRREGLEVSHKRVYRIYRALRLMVRSKRRKKVSQSSRKLKVRATGPNDRWSMDFLSDSLVDGRSLRIFAAVDDHTKQCRALIADVALPAPRVLRAVDQAVARHGAPKAIRTDNGPEFASRAFDAWAYQRKIEHQFIRPGKPIENAFA